MGRPKKILIIRFSSIGDIVMCTPVIRALYEQLNAEVHLLTKSSFKGILKDNPYLTKIHGIDNKVEEAMKSLKDEHFDLVVDLHHNLRSTKVKKYLGVKDITFNKLSFKRSLYAMTKIDLLPHNKVVDRHFEALSSLGIVNDGKGMDYSYSMNTELLEKYKSEPYVVLALGATHETKRMTPGVLHTFIKEIPYRILLLGGDDTKDLADSIESSDNPNVINLVGKTSISDSAMLIDHALYTITGDSAMMHIGAALQAKMIVVWGSTSQRFGFSPYYGNQADRYVSLDKDIWCRPCTKQGRSSCPLGHYNCMAYSENEIKNVLESIDELP